MTTTTRRILVVTGLLAVNLCTGVALNHAAASAQRVTVADSALSETAASAQSGTVAGGCWKKPIIPDWCVPTAGALLR